MMSHRPTPGDIYSLELLLDEFEELSEWEQAFLESLAGRERWTMKQGEKFDELRLKYLGE